MDFSWTNEQIQYKQSVVDFARTTLSDDLNKRDQQGVFSRGLWKKCADFGIQGMTSTGHEEDVDLLTAVLAMEGLGYGCRDNGLTFGLNAQMWTVQLPLQQFGTDEQKARYLPQMIAGECIGAHAITEPISGSDVFNMITEATRTSDGYVLNGKKCLVTFAPEADLFLVFANAKPELGKWGVTAFFVEKDTPGLTRSTVQAKMGLRTVPIGEVEFKNCFVPEANRRGVEGAGFSISNHSLEYERCCILASQLGSMERQLEETVEFARTRMQLGKPIGQFQSVSNRIADMRLRLETSRLLLYKVAWLKSTGSSAMLEAAMLKLHLSESFVDSSLDAIRTFGGKAYLSENGIERDLRDAIGGILYAGTSDIQRNIISKLLGL